ncbi:hypothetical protein Glove_482g32 [Diversispora epigaea]|uniref:TLDc domain-containing protein n=1 Tax=Diversispora epigaea TaxID=1348612 RepID=A0A397GJN8_9GLOM|nr:hypothetical protein Glove_482g32 [Diversispora epigaea]
MCHGHAGTIVVAKVSGTDEIVGGYNSLAWCNSTEVLSRVINSNGALYYSDSNEQNIYGPFFSNCEFMIKSEVSDFTQDELYWCAITTLAKYEKPINNW